MSDTNPPQYGPAPDAGPTMPPAAAPWGPDAVSSAPPSAAPTDPYRVTDPYRAAAPYGTSAPSGYGAPAAPQLNPGASAQPYASPWTQQVTAAYGAGLGNPLGPRPRTLGVTAFILALIAAVGAPIAAGFAAVRISPAFLDYAATGGGPLDDLAWLAPVAEWELLAEVSFYVGTGLGILAIILGFAAAGQRRGRGWGIWAIVLGFLGLPVFAGAMFLGIVFGAL